MTTEAFLREMESRTAKLGGSGQADPETLPSAVDGYQRAAAVLHVFDPRTLRPAGTPPEPVESPPTGSGPGSAGSGHVSSGSGHGSAGSGRGARHLTTLLTASVPAVGFRDRGLRMLSTPVRLAALTALGSRAAMRTALAANPERERTGVQQVYETWLDSGTFDLGRMPFTELEHLRQLFEWGLERFGDLPDRALVEQARTWRFSLRMFEHLVDRNFVGREAELAVLRDHLSLGEPSTTAIGRRSPGVLVITGVGGAGKTALVGRFLIDQFEMVGHGTLPFAYLPFDAETLDVREPYTVLLAAARQLSTTGGAGPETESPAMTEFQRVVADYRDHRGALNRRASEHAGRDEKIAELDRFEHTLLRGFADLVRAALADAERVRGSRTPALLVFDTFEEVAYRAQEDLIGFWEMLDVLTDEVPELRVVIAGRRPAAQPAMRRPATFVDLIELDEQDATALLVRLGVGDAATAAAIARQVGGNPLSLRLAAQVAQVEDPGPGGLAPRGNAPLSVEAIGAELVRGRLFRRLLDHIHDPAVRALAHPGMVLRRITPEVIYEVLDPAWGLEISEPARAYALFEGLRAEQALVSLDADGSLRYRPEVRRPVLELLARERPAQVRRIHELAVEYYRRRPGVGERAEELYHRLMLQQPDTELEDRWLPEVEPFIAPAIDELPVAQRRWLAVRMSIELAPEVYAQAELSEWERLIGRKALELVRYGDPGSVLELVGGRAERTADSPLYAIEARCWLDRHEPRPAAELLDRALAGYPVLGNPGRQAELFWLRAQAAGDDVAARLGFLDRLRRLVADFRSDVASVQVLTELLGLLNPEDLADPPGRRVGPVRRDLAAALSGLTEDEIGRESSLIRLALVRLGPHYLALVSRLAPLVVGDFGYLVRRGLIPVGPATDDVETTIGELPTMLSPEGTAEDEDRAYGQVRRLLDLLKAEKATLSGATLAGIDDYRESWELSSIREVRS